MLATDWNVTNIYKNITNILVSSLTSKNGHQHNDVANITVTYILLSKNIFEKMNGSLDDSYLV